MVVCRYGFKKLGAKLVTSSAWAALLWMASSLSIVWADAAVIIAPQHSLNLPNQVAAFDLPLQGALDPDILWSQTQTITQPANSKGRWTMSSHQRTAAKFTLSAQAEHIYTLEVPLVRMDRVDMFWRLPGKPWQRHQAGDTVPLSQWPIVGQYATFVLHFEDTPGTMDVVLVMQNAGAASVVAQINSDRESRERRLLQANTAGLLIGASAMVLLMNILLLFISRSAAATFLALYSASMAAGITILNGYAALWFTPEWPQFNDAIKPFFASILSATMLCACVSALERGAASTWVKRATMVVALMIAGYAVVQILVLPHSWRLYGNVAGAVLATMMVLGASTLALRRGDPYGHWVLLAALLFMASAMIVAQGYVQIAGIDIFATAMAALGIASTLVLRHVLLLRERFGRADLPPRSATH